MHPRSTLESWPRSYVQHSMDLCSSRSLALVARDTQIQRFVCSWYPSYYTDSLYNLQRPKAKTKQSNLHE
eukprot:491153-Karenia_brevis.AAC.1